MSGGRRDPHSSVFLYRSSSVFIDILLTCNVNQIVLMYRTERQTMIVGQRGERTLIIEDYLGERFEFEIGYRRLTIPNRDESGQERTVIFNMSDLIEKKRVPVGTTADEAYAVLRIVREMPRCSERTYSEALIKNYLTQHRRQRTEEYLLRLGELYGAINGDCLFHAVHAKQFRFPAYFMREDETAKLVHLLIDEYPGVASSSSYVPDSWQKAIEYAEIYGNSKFRCALIKARRELHLDNRRIGAAWDIARYLEKHRDDGHVDDGNQKISQIGNVVH